MAAPSGLSFARSLLDLAGTVAAFATLVLWVVENVSSRRAAPSRRRLAATWADLGRTPWRRVPGCLTGWLAARFDRLVRSGFEDADRTVAFGGLVMAVMLVFVPIAATVNATIGGSPFLFRYYLTLVAGVVFLNFAGEAAWLKPVNGIVAAYLGLSLWVAIPIYLVHAFTEVTINDTFSHGVLKSVLVAVFWYIAAYGVRWLLDIAVEIAGGDPAGSPAVRFVHGFLASLPVAYVLVFIALLAGHFAVLDQSPARSWQLVVVGAGIAALSLPLTARIMAWGAGRGGAALIGAWLIAAASASALSVALAFGAYAGGDDAPTWAGAVNVLIGRTADGAVVHLGPAFWVSHLPFVPLALFAAAVVAGFVARATVAGFRSAAGDDAPGAQPYLVAAVTSAGVAMVLWAAAW